MEYHLLPLSYEEHPQSPSLETGKENIRLAATQIEYADGQVQVEFHATYLFPPELVSRYRDFNEALVLVVNDIAQQDCFSAKMFNAFMNFGRDMHDGAPNMNTPPPLPLAARGKAEADSYRGGWLNGVVSFPSPRPVHRPSVFMYLTLENYVSNVVGLDLKENRSVEY
jgi:hypothetical protein